MRITNSKNTFRMRELQFQPARCQISPLQPRTALLQRFRCFTLMYLLSIRNGAVRRSRGQDEDRLRILVRPGLEIILPRANGQRTGEDGRRYNNFSECLRVCSQIDFHRFSQLPARPDRSPEISTDLRTSPHILTDFYRFPQILANPYRSLQIPTDPRRPWQTPCRPLPSLPEIYSPPPSLIILVLGQHNSVSPSGALSHQLYRKSSMSED